MGSQETVARKVEHEIAAQFVERWSPRAFTDAEIPDDVLLTVFEAARWAPSGFNLQPWRFIYAKRGSAHWETFLSLLSDFNRVWADKASALIVLVSKTTVVWNGKEIPATTHSFDTGAAWSNLAHQANLLGWQTHAVGGFDKDKTRVALNVPDDFAIEVIVAIGQRGDKAALPENFQSREAPSDRLPLASLVLEGGFPV